MPTNFSTLFKNLPTKVRCRSVEPQNTGHCWFKSRASYPDQSLIEAYLDGVDLPMDDGENARDELEDACATAFFPVLVGKDDKGEQGASVLSHAKYVLQAYFYEEARCTQSPWQE